MSGLFCFHRIDHNDCSRVGGRDQEMKVLMEMNDLEQEHNQYRESLRTERLGTKSRRGSA